MPSALCAMGQAICYETIKSSCIAQKLESNADDDKGQRQRQAVDDTNVILFGSEQADGAGISGRILY